MYIGFFLQHGYGVLYAYNFEDENILYISLQYNIVFL
jgi:hypothetical protein